MNEYVRVHTYCNTCSQIFLLINCPNVKLIASYSAQEDIPRYVRIHNVIYYISLHNILIHFVTGFSKFLSQLKKYYFVTIRNIISCSIKKNNLNESILCCHLTRIVGLVLFGYKCVSSVYATGAGLLTTLRQHSALSHRM